MRGDLGQGVTLLLKRHYGRALLVVPVVKLAYGILDYIPRPMRFGCVGLRLHQLARSCPVSPASTR